MEYADAFCFATRLVVALNSSAEIALESEQMQLNAAICLSQFLPFIRSSLSFHLLRQRLQPILLCARDYSWMVLPASNLIQSDFDLRNVTLLHLVHLRAQVSMEKQ